jgi:meiotically up-regulated gene 157 (Mug157) protein
LFGNTLSNTLDTAIRWRRNAAGSDEELAFVITGDINATSLRDSANQMQSYLSLLKCANSTLASLSRRVMDLQARYTINIPYCKSSQPPVESGIAHTTNHLGATTP